MIHKTGRPFQWNLRQTNDADIDADEAWEITTGSSLFRAAVIDGGLELAHTDFNAADKVLVLPGSDIINNDSTPTDDEPDSHGTRVAGILGALTNNAIGIAGVARGNGSSIGVRVMPVKACDAFVECPLEHTVPGIYFTVSNNADLSNNSYDGAGYSELERGAVAVAFASGASFVAAKGNTGQSEVRYPADYEDQWVIAVGGTNWDDARAAGATYGGNIDIAAPGQHVHSTTRGSSFGYADGTSFAAPHAAGVVALLLGVDATLLPEDINAILRASADDKPPPGYDPEFGAGRLNARRALDLLRSPYTFERNTVFGGTVVATTGWYFMTFFENAGGPLQSGNYYVRRHEVRRTITYLGPWNSTPLLWGRWALQGTGWSPASFNYQVGHVEVLSATPTTAELRTWVYEVKLGNEIWWYPASPSNVGFGYGALGVRPPFVVDATAPGLVTTKGVYDLTGSANYPAIEWLWERSDDTGATWSFWSSSQNAQFVAYAGQYRIDWRLSARRLTTSDRDTAWTATLVCIPYNPSGCGYAVPPVIADGAEDGAGPTTFALRQALTGQGLAPAGVAAVGRSPVDVRAQLQAEGLVALDYAVPVGRVVDVRIRIYDRQGRLVRTLVNRQGASGEYHVEWDRLTDAGQRVSPGVYVAIMEAAEFRATRKLVVTN